MGKRRAFFKVQVKGAIKTERESNKDENEKLLVTFDITRKRERRTSVRGQVNFVQRTTIRKRRKSQVVASSSWKHIFVVHFVFLLSIELITLLAHSDSSFLKHQPDSATLPYARLEPLPVQSEEAKIEQLRLILKRVESSPKNLLLAQRLAKRQLDFQLLYPAQFNQRKSRQTSTGGLSSPTVTSDKSQNQVLGHYNRTNVVIKAFNYKFRLNLELNNNLFGPSLIQKHFLPKGGQQISSGKLEHCYYHAKTELNSHPPAIGAFRTCDGLSGIIHVSNETFVIHPFYDSDLSRKHPHIIYRYQASSPSSSPSGSGASGEEIRTTPTGGAAPDSIGNILWRECGNSRLHEWALRQYPRLNSDFSLSSPSQRFKRGASSHFKPLTIHAPQAQYQKQQSDKKKRSDGQGEDEDEIREARLGRDVSLTEKYLELALVLSQDVFDKRNSSSRLEVLQDAIQIVNCLDLYFRFSANTRVALIYIETWAHGDQIELSSDAKQTLYNFLEYSSRKLYKVSMDATHLLLGGRAHPFNGHEVGMSIPESICSSRAVSVSQEASLLEPFMAAATMAHMLGHNLGMEHDSVPQTAASATTATTAPSSLGWAGPPANHPITNVNQRSNGQEQQEEHEDEVKSRSVSDQVDSTSSHSHQDLGNTGSNNSFYSNNNLLHEQASSCKTNCLMSAKFSLIQPPVSFGNMIQQQVATADSVGGEQSVGGYKLSTGQDDDLDEPVDSFTSSPTFSGERSGDLPFRFSKHSLNTYNKLLRQGRGICLFNKPNQLEDFRTCGNGIVERGEDCDCGSIQECMDSDHCCDPITCRFKADAECIQGACCDRCKLRPLGHLCRRSRSECDLAEVCDGKSEQCGPDLHKQNGYPCGENLGYCYLGQCPLLESQCGQLWGTEARQANRLCYTTLNVNGTIRGNCGHSSLQTGSQGGRDASSLPRNSKHQQYKRCELENVMCGTLQCQLGDMKPVSALSSSGSFDFSTSVSSSPRASQQQQQLSIASPDFSKKTIHSPDGQHHECKAITATSGTNASSSQLHHSTATQHYYSSISYVKDGSKCASNKVCFNFTCLPLEVAYRDSFESCPRGGIGDDQICSNHGVCSSALRCHCDFGWTGHDCSQRATTRPSEISTPIQSSSTSENFPARSAADRNLVSSASVSVQPMPVSGIIVASNSVGTQVWRAQNTETPSVTTTATHLPETPGSVVTPATATIVQDKKKHDALGAPTLVFILVSIVAAVYVGFALMANCYRRKGFLKPDKVLRHHQMNCRLDAIRNSFIAKRLADAAANGLDISSAINGGAKDPLVAAYSQLQSTSTCQHLAPGELLAAQVAGYGRADNIIDESPLIPLQAPPPPCSQYSQSQNEQSGSFVPDNIHYFKQQQQQLKRQQSGDCVHMNSSMVVTGNEPDPGDHIPLLMAPSEYPSSGNGKQKQQQQPINARYNNKWTKGGDHQRNFLNQLNRQSNKNLYSMDSHSHQVPVDLHCNWTASTLSGHASQVGVSGLDGAGNGTSNGVCPLNRAISLGNVNHNLREIRCSHNNLHLTQGEQQDEDERRAMSTHRALATPSRRRQISQVPLQQTSRCYLQAAADDSCSAPSSPEPHRSRTEFWGHDFSTDNLPSSRTGQSTTRPTMGHAHSHSHRHSHHNHHQHHTGQQIRNAGYHDEAIFHENALSATGIQQAWQRSELLNGQQVKETLSRPASLHRINNDTSELPPLPPPPLPDDEDDSEPISAEPASASGFCGHQEGTLDSDQDSSILLEQKLAHENNGNQFPNAAHINRRAQQEKRQPESAISPPPTSSSWFSHPTIKRVPLSGGEKNHDLDEQHLTLISQLQQLERVQQQQMNSDTDREGGVNQQTNVKLNSNKQMFPGETLHEFFSLPLSVQLSALLARNLNRNSNTRENSLQAPVLDDYLTNLLTNTTQAKRGSKQRQPGTIQQVGVGSNIATGSISSGAPSAGNSLKRQQIKLHNLQGLITRLQKLHTQTVLQQQLEELNLVDLEGVESRAGNDLGELLISKNSSNQQSALSGRRAAHQRINMRNVSSRSVHENHYSTSTGHSVRHPSTSQRGSSQSGQTKPEGSKSHYSTSGLTKKDDDSVYSMSDSEDGAFVTRMYVPTLQPQERAEKTQLLTKTTDLVKKNSNINQARQTPSPSPPPPPPTINDEKLIEPTNTKQPAIDRADSQSSSSQQTSCPNTTPSLEAKPDN